MRSHSRTAVLATVVATLGLLLAGCAGSSGSSGNRVSVVAAFYPLQFVAEQVGGDRVSVENLTKPGAEPHDLELTPRQVESVVSADLVVYLKGFQPAVDEAVAQNAGARALEVSSVVPLSDTGAPGETGSGGLDPHVWLDPTRLATITSAVADRLAAADPAGASTYHANAQTLQTKLSALDVELRTGLGQCRITSFVTSHAAFGYFAQRYGLQQIPISGLSPDQEPSPARLAEVATVARKEGVTTIFYETLVSPSTAQTVASELGLRTDVLDPLEGVADGDDYFSVMRRNLAALQQANECR